MSGSGNRTVKVLTGPVYYDAAMDARHRGCFNRFGDRNIHGDKRAASPVQQSSRNTMMLRDGQKLPVVLRGDRETIG